MSDDTDRRLAAAHRRARQGDRRDALRRRRLRPRPAARATRPRDRGSCADPWHRQGGRPRDSGCRRRSRRVGPPHRVDRHRPHLGAARPRGGGLRRSARRARRSRSPRLPPRTEPRPSSSTTSRSPAVVDVEEAMRPGAAAGAHGRGDRTTRQATSSRSTPASTTARRTIPTEELSRQRARPHHSRERRRRPRRSLRARRSSRGRSGRRGSTRRTSSRRCARPGSSRPEHSSSRRARRAPS